MATGIEALFNEVMAANQQRTGQATNDVGNVNSVTGEMVRVLQQQADKSQAVGEAEATAIEAAGARELAADAERKRLEAAIMHPHNAQDLVDFMGQSSARIAAQKLQLDAERAALVGKMGTKFSDDPLGWLVNAFTVPDEIRTYNAKYQGLAGEMEFQKQVDAALKGSLATQKQLESTTSAIEVHAKATRARNMADVVALDSQYKALQSSLTAVTVRNSLLASRADAARDILSAKLSVLANARADEEMADRRAARNKDKLEEDKLNRALPAAFAAYGLDPKQGTVGNWKKMKMVDGVAADAILKLALRMDTVRSSTQPNAIATLRLADDPAEAYSLMKRGLPLQGNGAQVKWLEDVAGRTLQELDRQKYNGNKRFSELDAKKREEIFRTAYNKTAAYMANPNDQNMSVTARELSALKVGGESLVDKAPNIAKLLAANPAFKDKTFTPEELVNHLRTTAFISGGVMDVNKRAANMQLYAKELGYLYTAKMQAQFLTAQPHLLGVATDPKAAYEYSVNQGQVGNLFPTRRKINPTRQEDWLAILLRETVK